MKICFFLSLDTRSGIFKISIKGCDHESNKSRAEKQNLIKFNEKLEKFQITKASFLQTLP